MRIRFFTVAHITLAGAVLLLVSLIGCSSGTNGGNSGSQTPPQSNPIPKITAISPSFTTAGSADTIVTLTGQGFLSATSIKVDGAAVTSTLLSSTQIQITISAQQETVAITHSLTASNPSPGGGTSAATNFTVNNPSPFLSSINPSTLPPGSPDTQITVYGGNFVRGTTVSAGAGSLATTYVSATQVVAIVPAISLGSDTTLSVIATNPAPGGGPSSSLNLVVTDQITNNDPGPKDATAGVDTGSFTYIVGTSGVPSSNSALKNRALEAQKHHAIAREYTSQSGTQWCTFAFNGPATTSNGVCVGHVPWMFQMAPGIFGVNGQDTANCGTASYLMVRSFYENNQNNSSCQQTGAVPACFDYPQASNATNGSDCTLSAQHITSLLQNLDPNPVAVASCNPAPKVPMLSSTPFESWLQDGILKDAGECDESNYSVMGGQKYAAHSCLYYEGTKLNSDGVTYSPDGISRYYGPNNGFSLSTLWQISQQQGFGSSVVNSAIPDAQDVESTHELDGLKSALGSGQPVILPVHYRMRVRQVTGTTVTCSLDGQQLTSAVCGGHYMVIVGMDAAPDGSVYVNDPFPVSPYGSNGEAGEYTSYTTAELLASWRNSAQYPNYLVIQPNGTKLPVSLVANSLSFTPAQLNTPYSATVSAAFGTPPFTFSTQSTGGTGNSGLPPGLSIDPASGTISGTPTSVGSFVFYVQVSDATAASADALSSITVGAGAVSLVITTPSNLPSTSVGQAYQQTLTASGGQAPYSWSTIPSSLPAGLTLTQNGLLSGTPTQVQSSVSTVQVVDATGQTANEQISITVFDPNVPPQIQSLTANPSTVGPAGTSALVCTAQYQGAGALSYVWSVTGGTISGSGSSVTWSAPTQGGAYTATCTVSDSNGDNDTRSIGISVNATTLVASISPTTGTSGSTTFTVSGTGASANGSVTASITQPDSTTVTSQTTANSSGQFTFTSFTESQVGTYSEVDTDVKTSAQSNTVVWTVTATAGAPTISNLSPPSYASSGSNQTMLINGTNYVSGDTLTFTDPQGDVIQSTPSKLTFVSSTQLSYQFNDGSDPGNWTVTVNSADGTQHSNVWTFSVQ